MDTLLLVDDDTSLLELLATYLGRAGYDVLTAGSGPDGQAAITSHDIALVILDVAMPGIDGWQMLQWLKERSPSLPVIMLTARSEEPDVLRGFSMGADDYVPKPFSFAQLEARVRAVLARAGRRPHEETLVLAEGDLTVDLNSHRVRRGGKLVGLTPTEFRLLVALMESPGHVLSARELVTKVWGPEYADETGYIRRHIWHLRQKLEDNPDQPRYVHNERQVGYYFACAE